MPRDPARNPIDDRIRAQHMLDAAPDVETIAKDQGTEDLRANMPRRRALLNAIQEIGEAAAKVSPLGRARTPAIPRESVVGMCNCLVLGYDKINLEVVWKAATEEIHPIIAALESAFVSWPLADAPRP